MNSSLYVQYASFWLNDMPRSLSTATHFSLYLWTSFLHSSTSFSIPNDFRISVLPPVMPSSFSACSSTGSPWVSHPALKTILCPRNVMYRYQRSLTTLPRRWPAWGVPFMVGGPSMKTSFGWSFDSQIIICKSIFARCALTASSIFFESNSFSSCNIMRYRSHFIKLGTFLIWIQLQI